MKPKDWPEGPITMQTKVELLKAWAEKHDEECKARWQVLVSLGLALIVAILGGTGWLANAVYTAQQQQIAEIRAVSHHVDTDARERKRE